MLRTVMYGMFILGGLLIAFHLPGAFAALDPWSVRPFVTGVFWTIVGVYAIAFGLFSLFVRWIREQ